MGRGVWRWVSAPLGLFFRDLVQRPRSALPARRHRHILLKAFGVHTHKQTHSLEKRTHTRAHTTRDASLSPSPSPPIIHHSYTTFYTDLSTRFFP